MIGTINNTAESAYNISCGYLKHYIGAQPAGTVVRIQIGTANNNWGRYVDVTAGGTEVVVDGDLRIYPISPTTTYATGIAPIGTTWTKSVINGVEKLASNTVNLKNLLEFGRNGEAPYIRGNANFDGALTFDVANTSATPFFDLSNTASDQSWNRGISSRNGTTRTAEIGMSGTGKTANSIYLGFGAVPWSRTNGLVVENATKKVFIFDEEAETTKGAQTKANTTLSSSQSYTDTSLANHANDVVKHITASERNSWNAKETPANAQTKANVAESNSKSYTNYTQHLQ
ncbi:hypothetical protein [Listeria riparia]|uniref:Uncharacterized protein n=1 Tax=Listeria riparia FSL S10-1204 TaxID=1265816 RepID=W7DCS6_9LIST|nr:hypothetical protein [Listeria riparia]EUJ45286.1 hypothetical protein PRIP_05468 [Listeria riparia FSL S10-1204]